MQTAPRRRNPPGARGLRAYAASLVVDDAEGIAVLLAPILRLTSPRRAAHLNTRTGS